MERQIVSLPLRYGELTLYRSVISPFRSLETDNGRERSKRPTGNQEQKRATARTQPVQARTPELSINPKVCKINDPVLGPVAVNVNVLPFDKPNVSPLLRQPQ